jgi:hypothetical protein
MKFKEIFNQTMNNRTKQVSFNIRAKEIKKIGLTPTQILEMTIPKNETLFYRKRK